MGNFPVHISKILWFTSGLIILLVIITDLIKKYNLFCEKMQEF
jgi:hypothetical protein